jgi:hypothetical protein
MGIKASAEELYSEPGDNRITFTIFIKGITPEQAQQLYIDLWGVRCNKHSGAREGDKFPGYTFGQVNFRLYHEKFE